MAESPHLWCLEVRRFLLGLGFRKMPTLRRVCLAFRDGALLAIVSVHVDDCLGCGRPEAEDLWLRLRKQYAFGKWQTVRDGFRHIGRGIA